MPTRMSDPHRNQMQSAQDVPARKVAVNVQKASSFRSRRIDCWEPELHKAFLQKGPGHVYLELQYRSTDKFLPSILQTPECSGAATCRRILTLRSPPRLDSAAAPLGQRRKGEERGQNGRRERAGQGGASRGSKMCPKNASVNFWDTGRRIRWWVL